VDDRTFGGGEGMVLKPEPIFECMEALQVTPRQERIAGRASESVVLLSPQGELFNQDIAWRLAGLERLVLICGRYEGVDERVSEFLADRELSIGDYVLSGGELAAAVVVETVTRLLPGALGNEASAVQESFNTAPPYRSKNGSEAGGATGPSSTCGSGGLLDYPHYTRPADYRGMAVPEVLVSGNHEEIRRWRRRMALVKTRRNRPDLLERVPLSEEDKELLKEA
jgi:tRNA (guanine37-N1)-methyltransferase